MSFCTSCRTVVPPDIRFCGKCGKPIDGAVSVSNSSRASSPNSRHEGYAAQHWHGELPLPQAYWINFVGLNILLAMLSVFLNGNLFTGVGGFFLNIFFSVWQIGGVFASAERYIVQGGKKFWGYTAQIVVVAVLLFDLFYWMIILYHLITS